MPARESESTTLAVHTTPIAAPSSICQRVLAVAARTMASGATISKYIEAIVAYWKDALTRSSPPTRVGNLEQPQNRLELGDVQRLAQAEKAAEASAERDGPERPTHLAQAQRRQHHEARRDQ